MLQLFMDIAVLILKRASFEIL